MNQRLSPVPPLEVFSLGCQGASGSRGTAPHTGQYLLPWEALGIQTSLCEAPALGRATFKERFQHGIQVPPASCVLWSETQPVPLVWAGSSWHRPGQRRGLPLLPSMPLTAGGGGQALARKETGGTDADGGLAGALGTCCCALFMHKALPLQGAAPGPP